MKSHRCCSRWLRLEQAGVSRIVVNKGLGVSVSVAQAGSKPFRMAAAWCRGSPGRSNLRVLEAMGSYWQFLKMGTAESNLHLGKTILVSLQITWKGMEQQAGTLIGRLFQ